MKKYEEPIISICIPTFNRSDTLRRSLEQYVKCAGFDNSVEIVISDNASTDDTAQVALDFAFRYSNIKYFRNKDNIRDSNFELALKRGTGKYLKLQNDASLFDEGALVYMKECIRKSDGNQPIFFTNDFVYTKFRHQDVIKCNSFDAYISALSTYVTAISCFGVWKKQLDSIDNFTKYTKYLLNQDDWSYQLLEKYGCCTLYNRHYYETLPKKSGGYHWFQVHLDNYYKILQPYVDKGLVSDGIIKQDKRNLLKHFIPELRQIYIYPISGWKFEKKGTIHYLWKYYKNEWYFYILAAIYPTAFILLNPIHYTKAIIKRIDRGFRHVE